MLWTIALVFALVWALGLMTSHTLGGFIHVLIVLAVAVLVIRMLRGRGNQGA